MRDARTSLAAFLPRTLWPLLGSGQREIRREGSILFADLAGFTRLTENLARIGHEGAEELTRICNAFFERMIGVVHEERGDVLRFGGDAMTIFFSAGTDAGVRAALRMQEESLAFQSLQTRGGVFGLSMKVGLSKGALLAGLVGDESLGYDYFAAGEALDRAAEAEHHAERGQVVLCPLCREHAGAWGIALTPLADGFSRIDGDWRDTSLRNGSPSAALGEPPEEGLLLRHLPPFIVERTRSADGLSAAEHRRTSVLFLSFRGIEYDSDPGAAEKVRAVYREIAGSVRKYGGCVNKLDMGDKGSKALCFFGTPQALEDQEEMACRAAMEILESPALRGALTEIRGGITSTRLFAAYVGSEARREYTVMGDGINLAARLMTSAFPWRALASEDVGREASAAIAFRELDPIFVKGKAEKVRVFRPEGEKEAAAEQAEFVGRETLLRETARALVDPRHPDAFAVTGEAGVGKSAFLHRLGRLMGEAGLRHVTVPLNSFSTQTYMAAFVAVLHACLGVGRGDDPELKAEALRQSVPAEDLDYLPLLNGLLGTALPETEATAALEAKDRKDVTFALLSRFIQRQALDRPYGVFLDHLEYADPASLEFLQVLLSESRDPPLKLLLAYRSSSPQAVAAAAGSATPLALPPLSDEETVAYLRGPGGMAPPPEAFVSFLQQKTRGNPKFLTQMLQALRKAGLVAPGPSGLLEVDEDRLASTSFPDTLEGLLLRRVDELPETERQLLKAASVLGDSFSLSLLKNLVGRPMETVQGEILALAGKGFVVMDTRGSRPYARFEDSLLRDALYGSLNFAVKRSFHKTVADLLEADGREEKRLWPFIAQHFEAAGEEEKARTYLWLSAEEARAHYDNHAAFNFLSRYVALAETAGAKASQDEQYRKALLYLTEASRELGRCDDVRAFCEGILEGREAQNPEGVIALLRLAEGHRMSGELQEAMDLHERALAVAKKLEDERLECSVFLDSGVPFAMTGRMEEALARFRKAEGIARRIKATSVQVKALMNQGLCHYHGGGRYDEALQVLKKARKVAAVHGLKPNLVSISTNLALVYFDLGEYKRALEIATEGLALSKQFGYRSLYVVCLSNASLYQVLLGRWDEAANLADTGLSTASHYGLTHLVAATRHTLGMLAAVQGSFSQALGHQSEAIQFHIQVSALGDAVADLNEVLALANQLNAPELAANALGRFLEDLDEEVRQENKARSVAFRVQHAIWRHRRREDLVFKTWQALEAGLESAEKLENLWLVAEVGEAFLRFLKEAGKAENAVVVGLRIFPMIMHHTSPLKVAPFLLAFADALLEMGHKASLAAVLKLLKRYEKTLDRGLIGIRYQALQARVAASKGAARAAEARLAEARRLAREVETRAGEACREAFLALPEIQALS